MSGTSADAFDAVLVDFKDNQSQIISTHSHPISNHIKEAVYQLALSGSNEIIRLRELDQAIAQLSCDAIKQLCKQSALSHRDIIAIGSHGQTVRHYPAHLTPDDKHYTPGYSLQVGDPNIIAEQTHITTVADFRRRDISAGGHGAPLVPAFHQQFFNSKQADRIIVNMGGIANITVLNDGQPTIGYDTGPANSLMDSWYQKHQHGRYDIDGDWARTGTVNKALLKQLLRHDYFSMNHPKSTGRETFNLPWLESQLQTFNSPLPAEDVQATLLHLTVESIALEVKKQDPAATAEVYICGGGAHNKALLTVLSKCLLPRKLATTEELGIHPDWVEAVAFAWLAKQTIEHKTSNLPSVTGAKKEVILGGIYWA